MIIDGFSEWFLSMLDRVQARRKQARSRNRRCSGGSAAGHSPSIAWIGQPTIGNSVEQLESRQLLSAIVVNSLADNTTSGDGQVTLREAIDAANNDSTTDLGDTGSGADVISFDPSLFIGGPATINLSMVGDTTVGPSALGITSQITIIGPNDANGLSISRDASVTNLRLFHVESGGDLTLQNLTLTNGAANGSNGGTAGGQGGGGGGAAGMGGALFNDGSLTLLNSTLSGNTALGGNGGRGGTGGFGGIGGAGGGGLNGPGQDSPYNQAIGATGGLGGGGNGGNGTGSGSGQPGSMGGFGSGGGGGGYGSSPGGIGGMGGFGAGAGGSGGNTGSSASGGFGGGEGGVAAIFGGGGGGGAGLGGGIFNNSGAYLTITNSTLSGNTAQGGTGGATNKPNGSARDGALGQGYGGAIFNRNGTVVLSNATVSGNTAADGGRGLFLLSDGSGNTANAAINNSILGQTDNSVSDFATALIGGGNSPASSGSNNVISNQTDFGGTAISADPLIGLLAGNGGPTQTMGLLGGSPAIGAAAPLTSLAADVSDTTTTTLTVNDATSLAVGEAVKIDNEIVLVTAIAGTAITVERGQMSTTAATHSNGTALTLATDQRGVARSGTNIDIGAFEGHFALLATAGTITYSANDPATAIDTGITISDTESPTLSTATVTITNFVSGEDLLAFTNDGSTMGNISGSFNSGTGVLTLASSSATATLAEWQAALRSVTYANTSATPSTTPRSVDFVVNDGTVDSNILTSTVNINIPAIIGDPTNSDVTENQAVDINGNLAASGTISISDVDSAATFQSNVIPAAGNLGSLALNSDGSYTYTVPNNAVQYLNSGQTKVDTFTITSADGTQKDVQFTIHGVNGSVTLSGTTLTVTGTAASDTITISEGATLSVAMNGATLSFSGTSVTLINIDGLGSQDTLIFTGTPRDETMTLHPGQLDVIGVGYVVHSVSTENIRVYAAGGNDTAYLYDSAGNDMFVATPTYRELSGAGYDSYAKGFSNLFAYASTDAGGVGDRAYLYDSVGNDTLIASPNYAQLSGTGYLNYAKNFDKVFAYASTDAGGGGDKAYLYDSAGNDVLTATPTYAQLTGPGYLNYASNFDQVSAFATAGDAGGTGDQAAMYDSAGNDIFTGTPLYGLLKGSGFWNYAQSFDHVYAYATAGDAGGVGDQAFLYDSAGNDSFVGRPQYSVLKGTGFENYAQGFDQVTAYATAGDAVGVGDQATLYDSAGNDTFTGTPTYGLLTGSGYYNLAKGFDQVTAFAVAGNAGGAGDQANLFDSAGNDTFIGRSTYSLLKGSGFYNLVQGFGRVSAYATAGDAGGAGDQASLYDSAGNDTFVGRPEYGLMKGTGYYNYAQWFDKVYAYATAGGTDLANLYDGIGNDTLYARANEGWLQGSNYYNYFKGFGTVNAYANAGGNDTLNVRSVTFTFNRYGTWENIL